MKSSWLLHWNRERLTHWRDTALVGIGAFLIIGMASQFDEWLGTHLLIHLKYSGGLLLIACAFFLLVPNRMMIIVGSLALVVVLGAIGTVTNQSLAVVPLMLVCGVFAYLLVRWETRRNR
jgi:hypothetical protein